MFLEKERVKVISLFGDRDAIFFPALLTTCSASFRREFHSGSSDWLFYVWTEKHETNISVAVMALPLNLLTFPWLCHLVNLFQEFLENLENFAIFFPGP